MPLYVWWCWTIGLLGVVGYQVIQAVWPTMHALLKPSVVSIQQAWKTIVAIVVVVAMRYLCFPISEVEILGHETQYGAIFLGQMVPFLGDTTAYPTMQMLWFLLGYLSRIFSSDIIVSIYWNSWIGLLSIWLWSDIIYARFSIERYKTIVWLGTLGMHIVWSHNIYNILWPFFFLSLALWLQELRKGPWIFAVLLAISMRMELVVFVPLYIAFDRIHDLDNRDRWYWDMLWSALVLVPVLAMAQGEVPGDGERWISIQNNIGFVQVYHPWIWEMCVFAVCYGISLWRKHTVFGNIGTNDHRRILVVCAMVIVYHSVMASFSDFSSRHAFFSLLCVLLLVPYTWRYSWLYWGSVLLHFVYSVNLRKEWYGTEEAFAEVVEKVAKQIPVVDVIADSCAVVVEMEPFVDRVQEHHAQPVLSHFNLFSPIEKNSLLSEYGCVDWCYTIQDWRWSSLGVEDRSARLQYLYNWKPIGIWRIASQECLLYRLED